MELERLVASLELCKELKELGVRQDSQFYWVEHYDVESSITTPIWSLFQGWDEIDQVNSYASAFTSGELGVALPYKTFSWRVPKTDGYFPYACRFDYNEVYGETESDVRAKMLIYLLENKIITVLEVNERLSK